MKIDAEKHKFLFSTLIAMIISYIVACIGIWQLVLISGFVAGFINNTKMKQGIYSGALGVFISWMIYILIAMITRNAYVNLDQFSGLIFGSLGYGWIVLIIIMLLGILFGALGGALGSGVILLVKERSEGKRDTSEVSKPNKKESPSSDNV